MLTTFLSDSHLARLAQIIDFTPDDLDANRKGQLTARQVRRLRTDYRRQYWPSLIAWCILGAIIGSLALTSLSVGLVWVIPFTGVAVISGLIAYEYRAVRRSIRADDTTVAREALHITEDWSPRRRFGVIEFSIGPRWFTVSRAAAEHLLPGHHYTLYYAPDVCSFPAIDSVRKGADRPTSAVGGSHRVLSLEPKHHA
jgi:hypothetical protein